MSVLDRKLLRDFIRLKWQIAAIAMLIACGVAVTVMAYSAQKALKTAEERFYSDTRFGDVFATCKRAPISLVRILSAIPGVAVADVRAQGSGLMQVPGLSRPATARLISLPDEAQRALNRVQLLKGRFPDETRPDEVVALKTFLEAAHVQIGDRLVATINGREVNLKIVGSVLSPEYVYVPSPESTMPDDAHQGVFWGPTRTVARITGLDGAFNTVSLKLAPGAALKPVLLAAHRTLSPYGGVMAVARADQASNRFIEAEMKELSTSAAIIPPVFLIVAAALVHLVIARLVEVEREQIGLLKAFGYSDFDAATPYFKLGALIGLLGAAAGGLLGLWFGASITRVYTQYMRFPTLTASFSWPAFAIASAVALAATSLGSVLAVRRATVLSPAVAMQPPRPADYRAGPLDRLVRRLDQPTRMILRSLERFPARALMTTLGLAASLTLLVGSQFMFHALDYVLDHAYYRVQRWSDAIGFSDVRDMRAMGQVGRLPGVFAVEPVRTAIGQLRANGQQQRIMVEGLQPGSLLARPLDASGRRVPFEGRGLILSEALARKLTIAPGDVVDLEITEARRASAILPVTATARDYSGLVVFMARAALNRLLAEGDVATGAQLLVRPAARPEFYRAIEQNPQIVAASSRDDTVAGWRQAMTAAFRVTITFYVGFAAAIAFGVAFNTGRTYLAERSRDLATLHVLGFDHSECIYILLGELLVLSLAAIPLGFVGGRLFAAILVLAYSRDELRLPALVGPESYGAALAAYLAAVMIASAIVGRRIWTLDLVSVLKTRE